MESCLRSKLKFSGCLAGTFAGVLCLDGFEFARMRMKSVPDEVEVVPACTVEAAGIALLEHEAPTNDRVDDDFWFSPTSGRPQRLAIRRGWETVALVGEIGALPWSIS
jgi:hypothetical protein